MRILLTGDDGYNAIGTRVLIHFLKKEHSIAVVGTRAQQSGVGGKVSMGGEMTWEDKMIDGVPAICVDGTPVDAVEFARSYFEKPFDLLISGINFGLNIGGCVISSGTFAAAFRGTNLGLSRKALVYSYDVPFVLQVKNHALVDDISKYLEYPGKTAYAIFQKVIENNFWGADMLNINLPSVKTSTVQFAKFLDAIYGYWPPIVIDKNNHTCFHPKKNHNDIDMDPLTDTAIVAKGNIAMSPTQLTMLNEDIYEKTKHISFSL